jgi:hypothetical protein
MESDAASVIYVIVAFMGDVNWLRFLLAIDPHIELYLN